MWHEIAKWGMVWVGSGWLAIGLYVEFEPEAELRKMSLSRVFFWSALLAPLAVLLTLILFGELAFTGLANWRARRQWANRANRAKTKKD